MAALKPFARSAVGLAVALMAAIALSPSELAAPVTSGAAQEANHSDKAIVMKLASPSINDNQHEWMKRYAVAIEKQSGGRIKVELYPAGQLGSIPRLIEGTQLGSIQLVILPPEFFVGVDPRFELLSAAGIFESEQHAIRTISDAQFAKAFLALGVDKGLIGASLFLSGPQSFVTRTPFRTLADLKGKKIRVLASQFQTEQIARLGAIGVPMSFGDVLPALQQGTIDGALGSLQVFAGLGYYDTTKYMNETGHAYVFSLAVLSKKWLDGLPGDLQAMVRATAQDIGAEVNPWQIDFLARQRKVWVEKGGELDVLSAADKAEMMTKLSPVGDDIVKTKPDLKPLWDQLIATAKRSN